MSVCVWRWIPETWCSWAFISLFRVAQTQQHGTTRNCTGNRWIIEGCSFIYLLFIHSKIIIGVQTVFSTCKELGGKGGCISKDSFSSLVEWEQDTRRPIKLNEGPGKRFRSKAGVGNYRDRRVGTWPKKRPRIGNRFQQLSSLLRRVNS